MTLSSFRWALPGVLALLTAVAWAAPGGPSLTDKKAETPAEKVRKALDEVTDVSIAKMPLPAAIKQLGDQSKINFVVDTFTLQQQLGELEGLEVNLTVSGVKLRTALRTMLSQHNLGYAILGDTVLITTEDLAMHRQMGQRVSLDIDKLPVEKALKQLSRETGTNLLLDARLTKEAQTPVTLQLEDVPLETAVKLLGHMAGLRTVRIGNVLFVTSKETANELRQDSDGVVPPPQPPPGAFRELRGGQFFLPAGGLGQPGQAPAVPANPPPAPEIPKEKPPEFKDK